MPEQQEPGPKLEDLAQASYGAWVSTLAPWSHFITLTHDPRRLRNVGHDRIGRQLHARRVRTWFYDHVRRLDPTAQLWAETELHVTGQPHEHALGAFARSAPDLKMRQAWYELGGWAQWEPIRDAAGVAAYVAKYAGKRTSGPPTVLGFGLLPQPSYQSAATQLLVTKPLP